MDKYMVYFGQQALPIDADNYTIDEGNILTFYELRKIVACFNINNIIGFKKYSTLENLKAELNSLNQMMAD